MTESWNYNFDIKEFFHQQVASDEEFAKYADHLKKHANNNDILKMKGAIWALGDIVNEAFGKKSQEVFEWKERILPWAQWNDCSFFRDLVTPEA